MSTSVYVHDVVRIEVEEAPHRLEKTCSHARKITATDKRGQSHEFILFADTREALAMPGDAPAADGGEAAEAA